MEKICDYCRKTFDTKNSKQLFCSRSCSSFRKSENRIKKGRTYYSKICLSCDEEFKTLDKRQKFCSHSCAAKSNNARRLPKTKEQRKKISESLKRYFELHPEKIRKGDVAAKSIIPYTKGKYREYPPDSILELSTRTIGKILKRLNIGCSLCGWDKCICDIHHIEGKKIEQCDKHGNLTYVCPNCHRMLHNKLIPIKNVITLENYIGETWKKFYYG